MLALASVQLAEGHQDAARHSFEALLAAHPDCGRGWLGLGLLELSRTDLPKARECAGVATDLMPDHIGSWHALAWSHILMRDPSAARIAFERALMLDRAFAETHGGLAVIAAMEGRETDARAGIRRALRLDAQCLSARCAEVLLLQIAGKYDVAKVVMEEVLSRPGGRDGTPYRDLLTARILS